MRRWQRELDMEIPLPNWCRCGAKKHPDNAVCDACGDVCGCAYCGGSKEVPDATHRVGDGYEGFLFAGPQRFVRCPECA